MTSVKVHAGPGGKTSIDLFSGYGKDKEETEAPVRAPEVEAAGEEKKDDEGPAGGKAATESHTSIKVRQPPGGASSFSFG